MKKYIFMLLAAMAMLSSCTNDDIGTIEHSYKTFTLNVSTEEAYNTFNSVSTLKKRFLSGEYGDFYLGVYTFIYDANGDLVTKDFQTSKTFGMVSHDFTIEHGKYTIVTVEMIVDKDDNYKSDAFEMRDVEKLSTVQVGYRQKTSSSGTKYYVTSSLWYESVGVSTKEFSVDVNTTSISVVPKAIGCVVNCSCYNFDKCSDKNILVLSTKNCPIGRRLNPAITGNDRFVYESYNSGNTAVLRYGCYTSGKFDAEEGFDVYLLEEGTDLDCGIGSGTYKDGTYSWYPYGRDELYDGKIYYAGLYYVGSASSTGLDGGIFETTSEFNTWYNKAKKMYDGGGSSSFSLLTPYMTWGASVSAVQSSMTGYSMTTGSSGKAVYNSTNNCYVIEYAGKGSAAQIGYAFSTATTGLFESDVVYSSETVTKTQLQNTLANKYTYLTEQSGYYLYMTSDAKTVIMLMTIDGGNIVGYIDYSKLTGAKLEPMAKAESGENKIDVALITNYLKQRKLNLQSSTILKPLKWQREFVPVLLNNKMLISK